MITFLAYLFLKNNK